MHSVEEVVKPYCDISDVNLEKTGKKIKCFPKVKIDNVLNRERALIKEVQKE